MSDRAHALELLNVSRETIACLEVYEKLLTKWTRVTNLIGPSELRMLWTRHFIDSLQLKRVSGAGKTWADLGTGAGFPGLVLAIDSLQDREAHFHLIEPDGRKCAFLREVVRATGISVTVHRARAEDVLPELGHTDMITSRAMAPLEHLVHLSEARLRDGAIGLFPKGKDYLSEVATLSRFVGIDSQVWPSLTSADAAIVRVQLAQQVLRSPA